MADDRKIDPEHADGQEEPRVFKVANPGSLRTFLQTLSKGAAIGATAVAAENCENPSSPGKTSTSSSSSTSTSTSSSTTSTSTTTTVVATFTLAGVVTDRNGRPVVGARVFVVDGANANKFSLTDGNGYYSIPALVQSNFTLRTTLNGVFLFDMPVGLTRDTRLDFSVTTTTSTTSTSSTTTTRPSTTTTTSFCTCNPQTLTYFYPN